MNHWYDKNEERKNHHGAGEKVSIWQKVKLNPISPCILKSIQNGSTSNVNTLSLNSLKENLGEYLSDFGIEKGAFKHYTKRGNIKEKIDILDFIKTRNLYSSEVVAHDSGIFLFPYYKRMNRNSEKLSGSSTFSF